MNERPSELKRRVRRSSISLQAVDALRSHRTQIHLSMIFICLCPNFPRKWSARVHPHQQIDSSDS